MKKILVTAAHSDDLVIGMGGTLKNLSTLGHKIWVVSACGDRISGFEDAMHHLGVEALSFPYRYGEIDEEEFSRKIEELFKKLKPDIVFTHWQNEILYDHELVGRITLKIARKEEKEVYLFEIPASSLNFDFDIAIDITDFFDHKKQAIEMMKDAFDEKVFLKEIMPSVVYTPGFRGIQVGCDFAEVFKHCGSRFPLAPFRKKLLDIARI
ncbi:MULTISPECIES: PIG-L deacetylase family protein [Pseudothermotoga]|uniref:PIG-L deacetylase family protein n=1 Tax=Pseudothermotoga TaxID=1643951 RepID=UPI00041B0E78|nr:MULTISPECIES: PIG-L deacetylase family protein [Pseudothermotoga]KUK19970.1 MAG: LmbE family protein [Pseudothermotoga lettingae]HBT26417.1 hypothetical protein [Pseudothermotoga sp.]